MPRATLKVRSNDGLVALSEAHPAAAFDVLGAWPDGERLRLLVETGDLDRATLESTLAALPEIHDFECRHAGSESVLVEVTTPTPEPHGAMADSGVVPSFPLRAEGGWLVGDLVASREQLGAFRDELEAGGIDYRIARVSESDEPATALLTDRQREVVDAALDRGYYETPRECTLTDLADDLGVHKSAASRVLRRAEGRIVAAYRAEREDG